MPNPGQVFKQLAMKITSWKPEYPRPLVDHCTFPVHTTVLGASSNYYRDQQSLFFEENINSLRITVHTTVLDEMTTTSSNLKLFPKSYIKNTKTMFVYKGPELTLITACWIKKQKIHMLLKKSKNICTKNPITGTIFFLLFFSWKHGNLRSITKKLEELNYQMKDKLKYEMLIYT